MTKKHFLRIAIAMENAYLKGASMHATVEEESAREELFIALAEELSVAMQGFNPNFNKRDFLTACGLG